MRFFVFIFSILIALAMPLSFAAANDSEPPAAPGGEGAYFGKAVFANGSAASSMPLAVLVRGSNSETLYRTVSDSSGRFVLQLENGSYLLDAVIDVFGTPGMDYAATSSVTVPSDKNEPLSFYPAGSLSIVAEESGSPAPGAEIRVSCPSSGFDISRINGGSKFASGPAGDLLVRALPTGTCVISASTDSLAGSSEASIEHGKVSSVTVQMRKKSSSFDWALPAAFAIAAAALAAYFLFAKGRRATNAQPQHSGQGQKSGEAHGRREAGKKSRSEKEAEPSMADRLSDPKVKAVLATLSDREAEIVRFLFKSGGRAKRSQIQHRLLIPKTSLLRNLRSLERKKIVKLTPFGRNLLAEIDGWLNK